MFTIELYAKYRFGVSAKFKGSPKKFGVYEAKNRRGDIVRLLKLFQPNGTVTVLRHHRLFHIIDAQPLWQNRHKKFVYTLLCMGKELCTLPMTEYAASMLFWNVERQGVLPKYLRKVKNG